MQLPVKASNWRSSRRLTEVQTAKSWGLTPSQFYDLDEDDQAYMMALDLAEGLMSSWETQVASDKKPAIVEEEE